MNGLPRIPRSLALLALAAAFLAADAAAAAPKKEGPEIRLAVFDRNNNTPLSNFQFEVQKLTAQEKKQDSYVYTVTIRKTNYNPYSTTFAVPFKYKPPVFWSTNYLTPFFSGVLEPAKPRVTSVVISGVIRDIRGNPIPNVMVQLYEEDMSLVREYLTAADGRYVFSNVPPKTYTIKSESTKDLTQRRAEAATPGILPAAAAPVAAPVEEPPAAPQNRPALADGSVLILAAENQTLVLKHTKASNIKGLLVAVRSGTNRLFITPFHTLTSSPDSSANIWSNTTVVLEGREILVREKPLFTDGEPVTLMLYGVYADGTLSEKPYVLDRISTRDIIPPSLPSIDGVSLGSNTVLLRWHRLSPDREELAYRIYLKAGDTYGILDEIRDFSTNAAMARVVRLKPGTDRSNLVLTVTAIDRFGNESEFKKTYLTVEVASNRSVDMVMDSSLGPPVVFEKPPPPVVIPPRVYTPFELFARNNYALKPGAVLRLRDRELRLPAGARIAVPDRARLVLENVSVGGKDAAAWEGILVDGGTLELRNCALSGAVTAIAVRRSGRITASDTVIVHCRAGLTADASSLDLKGVGIRHTGLPLRVSRGRAALAGVSVVTNAAGPSFEDCAVTVSAGLFAANRSGLEFRRCTGSLTGSAIVRNRGDGVLLQSSSLSVASCRIASNTMNGVACSDSDPEIRSCDIEDNGFYAVKDGGGVVGCFVARNNRAPGTDNSPDNGTDDGRFFSFSNSSIRQIYAADFIRGLSPKKTTKQE